MAATATPDAPKTNRVSVQKWGIEADHPRNGDLWIKCIPNCRLRTQIRPKPVVDDRTGNATMHVGEAVNYGTAGTLPGMQLLVDPATCECVIIDPTHDDPEGLKRWLKQVFRNSPTVPEMQGQPPRREKIDVDHMKTLCREMKQLVELGHAKVCTGELPKAEDIDALPGDYLLDAGAFTTTFRPKYEKDYDEWHRRQGTMG